MTADQPRAYRIGPFRVDLVRHCIIDAADAVLPVSSRAYDALLYLIEHRDRVVGKDELMKVVWPKAVVEENNLNQAISSLRRAFGDSRESPRYLATIPGRGYRFVADVRLEFAESSTPLNLAPPSSVIPAPPQDLERPSSPALLPQPESPAEAHTPAPGSQSSTSRKLISRRPLLALGAIGLATAGGLMWSRRQAVPTGLPRSIAVLPFKPLVTGGGDQALELGISETLINRLSLLPAVTVTPLSSVRRYAGADHDPLAAGRELDVAAVIEGHVQLVEGRVRLTARLLDVEDGRALWSGRFDENADDFFAVEDALARQIVDALAVDLSGGTGERLTRHYTENLEAWQLYLNGRYHWEQKSPDGFRKAIEFYEAAERADPRFPLPAAGLADVWAVFAVFGMLPPQRAFESAEAAARRAISLDRSLAEAVASLGHIEVQRWRRWRDGEDLYRKALRLRPTYAQAVMWLANNSVYQGRIGDGLDHALQAQALEPMSISFAANVGLVQFYARDYDAALRQLSGLADSAPPAMVLPRVHLARTYCALGQPERALALMEDYRGPGPGVLTTPGWAYALAGRVDDARGQLARLEALGRQGYGVGYDLAVIHAALGERDAALAAIERAEGDLSQMVGFLNSEPAFDSIRDDPRFRAVSRRLGLG